MKSVKITLFIPALLFTIFCNSIAIHSQDSSFSRKNNSALKNSELKHTFSLNIGVSDYHIRDELASPWNYSAAMITYGGSYSLQGENFIHKLEVSRYIGTIKPGRVYFYAPNYRLSARYSYSHLLTCFPLARRNFSLYGGGGIYSFYSRTIYRYGTEKDYRQLVYSWYLAHTFELSAVANYSAAEFLNVRFGFDLPVFSNVSRPTYSSYDTETSLFSDYTLFGNTRPFWENFTSRVNIEAVLSLSKMLSFSARYDLQYSSYNEPRKVVLFMNDFRFTTQFTF